MGNLNHETLKLLQQTAVEAASAEKKIHVFRVDEEPEEVYFVANSAGTVTRHQAQRFRNHTLGFVSDIPAAVGRWGEQMETADPHAVAWYSRDGVQVIFDDGASRRNRAACPFHFTDQFSALSQYSGARALDQKSLIRTLRYALIGHPEDHRLLNWAREVRWSVGQESRVRVAQGKDSLGRDIEQEARSTIEESCPEILSVRVRVFANDPFFEPECQVDLSIEVDVEKCAFVLTVLPEQLDLAIEFNLSRVREFLTAQEHIDVFRGRPGD